MLKWIERISWVVAFAGLCWLVGSEAINASRHQRPIPETTKSKQRTAEANSDANQFHYSGIGPYVDLATNYCTSKSPNEQHEWTKKFICESKITDAVIACLTLFLVFFTGLLVLVGSRQEKTTRRQMRAFVYLEGGSIYNVASPLAPLAIYKPTGAEIVSPSEGPLVLLTIKNTGSTPAYKVVHWGNILVAQFPLKGSLPPLPKSKIAPSSAIPPGGINTKRVKLPGPLTTSDIAGLRNGTMAIWIYGEIIYRDAFRRKRTSQYRLFHNITSGAIGVANELTWAEGGNDAT